jgi:hypothetical protein
MIQIDIKVTRNLTKDIDRILNELAHVPHDSLIEFKSLTPIDKGNARRNTTLVNGATIRADYPYAQVLNDGRGYRDGQMRGSTQAPQGMTRPFDKWLRARMKQIFGK